MMQNNISNKQTVNNPRQSMKTNRHLEKSMAKNNNYANKQNKVKQLSTLSKQTIYTRALKLADNHDVINLTFLKHINAFLGKAVRKSIAMPNHAHSSVCNHSDKMKTIEGQYQ